MKAYIVTSTSESCDEYGGNCKTYHTINGVFSTEKLAKKHIKIYGLNYAKYTIQECEMDVFSNIQLMDRML